MKKSYRKTVQFAQNLNRLWSGNRLAEDTEILKKRFMKEESGKMKNVTFTFPKI